MTPEFLFGQFGGSLTARGEHIDEDKFIGPGSGVRKAARQGRKRKAVAAVEAEGPGGVEGQEELLVGERKGSL